MSGDDEQRGAEELRSRLQGIPGPRAALDADAVIAAAKRRRRPKTVALSSAATVAGVLILAPLVVPGMQLLQPSGGSVMVDSGAAPEAAPQPDSGAAGDEQQTRPGDATDAGEAEESSATLCGLARAGDIGLVLSFGSDPAEGTARVWVSAEGDEQIDLVAVDLAQLETVDGIARAELGEASEQRSLAPGGSAELTVTTGVLDAGACGAGTPSGPAPVAILGRDGAQPIAVVGSAWK